MNNSDKKLWTFHQTDNVANLIVGHPRQDILFKKINKFLKKGRVLEIGFGDGYLLDRLSSIYECYGADISSENIDRIAKKVPGGKFSLIGVDGSLPYEDGYFDGFVASEVLEHMTDQELSLCVDEIARVLKSGGYGFITFPAKEKLEDSICYCPNCENKFHKWGHKQHWNENKIKSVFNVFNIVDLRCFFTPYSGKGAIEWFLGRSMWLVRNILNKMIDVPNKTYLLILNKK